MSNNSLKSMQQQPQQQQIQSMANGDHKETRVEKFSFKKPITMEYPFDDGELTVFVSAVANPNCFWVHIVDDDTIKLDRLVDSMQDYYEKNKNDPVGHANAMVLIWRIYIIETFLFKALQVTKYDIGDLVAARFNGTGWYRGEIKTIVKREELSDTNNNTTFSDNTAVEQDNELIDLYYVDFGDSAYVEKSALRKLLTEFVELPCQAIQCSMNDIEPSESDKWNESAVDFFEDITYPMERAKI
jgi:tudor domain-containing protein 2